LRCAHSKREAYSYFDSEEKWPYSLREKQFDWLLQSIKSHLESIEEWVFEFSSSEKEEVIILLLEPMRYDDDLVKELLNYADEFHKKS
jgi:hypothetical protein